MAGAAKPYYEETWFEVVFLAGCFTAIFFLFYGLMPTMNMNNDVIQTVSMAKLFAEGRVLDAFSHFNMPPIYPLLLALMIKLKHTTELLKLIAAFQALNLGLCMASGLVVHFFARRQMGKPYTFIITALYLIAPSTLAMAWSLSPIMLYTTLSLGSLLAIDISLSKESVLGGQLSRGEILVCGICLGLSVLSWQVGYLLILAFLFVMVKRFGMKRSLTIIGGLVLCISPFIGRDVFYVVRRPDAYVASSMSIVQTVSRQGFFRTVEAYADTMLGNLATQAVGDLNLTSLDRLANAPARSGPTRTGIIQQPWLRWLIGVVAIVGAGYGLYQYTGIGTLYLCIYVITALALLPNAGLGLAPVLALLLFYLYYGLMRTGQWLNKLELPLISRLAVPVLTVWILLCSVTQYLGLGRGNAQAAVGEDGLAQTASKVMYMSTAKEPESRLQEAQAKSAHRRAMDWLKAHTSESARVAVPRPGAASQLVEGGKDDQPDADAKRKAFQTELKQYDYLVEEGASQMGPAQAASGYGLKMVYEDLPGRTRIWQIQSPQ